MTWGSGEDGCLGHGNNNDVTHARLVEDLVGCTVAQISCGAAHMMALTSKHDIFSLFSFLFYLIFVSVYLYNSKELLSMRVLSSLTL